jgi:hypothetical protein
MISTGSIDDTERQVPVATSFTQSVDPGGGVTITLAPRSPNQPIFCATAWGEAAALMVLAHQPTRMVFRCGQPSKTPGTTQQQERVEWIYSRATGPV